jgi:isopropylmalate/homocitrate/citramalate synthase
MVSAPRRIVLGKKSGLVSIRLKVEELGLDVPEDHFPDLLARVKRDATAAGRLLSDDEFRRLARSPSVRSA